MALNFLFLFECITRVSMFVNELVVVFTKVFLEERNQNPLPALGLTG